MGNHLVYQLKLHYKFQYIKTYDALWFKGLLTKYHLHRGYQLVHLICQTNSKVCHHLKVLIQFPLAFLFHCPSSIYKYEYIHEYYNFDTLNSTSLNSLFNFTEFFDIANFVILFRGKPTNQSNSIIFNKN